MIIDPHGWNAMLRYDMIGAIQAGETRHPQTEMRQRGLYVCVSYPVPIADCWLFWVRSSHPIDVSVLPAWIEMRTWVPPSKYGLRCACYAL